MSADQSDQEYAAGARAALAADVNDAWRKAVGVEYDQWCADYSNRHGRPGDDRHISAADRAAQWQAIEAIAERLGLPTGPVNQAVREVAERYGRDHTDTQTLGQPDWGQVADQWADYQAEQQAYRDGSASAAAAEAAARDREITGTYRDMGWTAEQIAEAEDSMTVEQAQDALDRLAAYEAAVSPPAAVAAHEASIEAAHGGDDALEDAYYDEVQAEHVARAGDERAQREREGPTSAAWRTAAAITYREHVMEYGNDGRPEDDRHLSAGEIAARAFAVTLIAGATGVSEAYVSAQLRDAADAEGSARGFDNDPDYLAPPNWGDFVDRYETEPDLRMEASSADEATGMTAAQLAPRGLTGATSAVRRANAALSSTGTPLASTPPDRTAPLTPLPTTESPHRNLSRGR